MLRMGILVTVIVVGCTACQTNPFARNSNPTAEIEPLDSTGAAPQSSEAPILPPPGLALAPESRFADVPIPAGLTENLERTYVFESRNLQVGRMVYESKASVSELAQFYIREAPTSDWKLESVLQADGAELSFRKPGKRLQVSIHEAGMTRGRSLVVHLTPDDSGV